jgi:hypothetical protein
MWVCSSDLADGPVSRVLDCTEADASPSRFSEPRERYLRELLIDHLVACLVVRGACRGSSFISDCNRVGTLGAESVSPRDELSRLFAG